MIMMNERIFDCGIAMEIIWKIRPQKQKQDKFLKDVLRMMMTRKNKFCVVYELKDGYGALMRRVENFETKEDGVLSICRVDMTVNEFHQDDMVWDIYEDSLYKYREVMESDRRCLIN